MPKMGESIMEATILKWLKQPGDPVEQDEMILEIATDKVDSEVPSPADGVLGELLFDVDDVVAVGTVIATIQTEGSASTSGNTNGQSAGADRPSPSPNGSSNGSDRNGATPTAAPDYGSPAPQPQRTEPQPALAATADAGPVARTGSDGRFYSPLVRNIAKEEGIGMAELERISGTGAGGRVNKADIFEYLENRGQQSQSKPQSQPATDRPQPTARPAAPRPTTAPVATSSASGNSEIVEMDRMRRLIADHMVNSKRTSPHVTSFVEVDVTNLVNWRNRVKGAFQKQHGQKITFTPLFVDAVARALRDFPMVNVSVDGNNIVVKKDLNIGMAAALPSGNLIVPVIHHADELNLLGLTKRVNDLANRARQNQLKPQEIQGGTFTLTNVGTFGNVMGTPIINQPQVAILATGAIRKKPAVVETEFGDLIAVRQMMFLSLSYDHRVVDGFLGGSFLRRVGDYLEQFDDTQVV